ncbi:cytochrome c [Altererythrobacter sp. B11]|uniref:c-type cytochrome n=1 Tax=Altererythrobacter sp. B11 TaxID=2060312 RepID=UPI000DC71349|nr:cytochrome c [Altererythrobacter sp. B11]BBC71677.1 cytochrome c [Altererythrobacter sp. B11]
MAYKKPYDLKRHLPSVSFVVVALMASAAVAGAFIYTGVYNIGADAPHWSFVYNTLDTLRERSISRAADGIRAPTDLDSPDRIASGAGLYTEMCTGCHLGPGLEPSEMSQGLYPQAPRLASAGLDHTPAEQFWAIKHGIKLSAMPAWGKTHNDELIWDMVAFVRKLPKMSPAQYNAIIASAPADHDEMMEGMAPPADGADHHGGGSGHDAAMEGMAAPAGDAGHVDPPGASHAH